MTKMLTKRTNPYKHKFNICINMGLASLIDVRKKDLIKHLDDIIYNNLKTNFLETILTFQPLNFKEEKDVRKKADYKDKGFHKLTLVFGNYNIDVFFVYEYVQKKIYIYTNIPNTPVYYLATINKYTSFESLFKDFFNIHSKCTGYVGYNQPFFTLPIDEIDYTISDYIHVDINCL
jgi:hypothetical protein